MSRQLELPLCGRGEAPSATRSAEAPTATHDTERSGASDLMERVCERANLQAALKRVRKNKGSYGFRPRRSAHDAVVQAQRYIGEGRCIVVGVDLEKFFDRLNHDVLMGRLAKRIEDKRLLGLNRRFLEAGVMAGGVATERHEGTPQGGPLSPLLANVLLDEVDKELEKRGYTFVRYADDCNVYVRSRRAGVRVMSLLRRLYARLRLRINEDKSAIDAAWNRKLLGYSFWVASERKVNRRVAPKALRAMKDRVREITRRNGGRSLERVVAELRSYWVGWKNYFRLTDTPRVFRELDEWIRRRLRALQLKHWRHGRTLYRELRARGLPTSAAKRVAANANSWWKNSAKLVNVAFPISYFDELGLPWLAA